VPALDLSFPPFLAAALLLFLSSLLWRTTAMRSGSDVLQGAQNERFHGKQRRDDGQATYLPIIQ